MFYGGIMLLLGIMIISIFLSAVILLKIELLYGGTSLKFKVVFLTIVNIFFLVVGIIVIVSN
jgi:hypothetical protein